MTKRLLIDILKSKIKGSFFYTKDVEDDYGVYQSGTYESGKPRAIYLHSCSKREEAENLCDKLNSGELTVKDLREQAEQRAKDLAYQEWIALELKFQKKYGDEY